jgi:hypothetical protein
MGHAKDMMMEREDNLRLATGYLVRAGSLEKCGSHGEVYGGGYSDLDDDFYRRAVGEWKKGEKGDVVWADGMEVREFTDLLKAAYEDHPADECYRCAKLRAE